MTDSQLIIIAAKVTMLERLVRALYKEAFLKEPGIDPAKAIERYSAAVIGDMESATESNSETTRLVLVENLTIFFDQLKAEIQDAVDGRDQPPA